MSMIHPPLLVLDLLFLFLCAFNRCYGQASEEPAGNVIHVSEPSKNTVWQPAQHSYHITWSQSSFCFQWNIELLNNELTKVSDITKSLSEFKEGEMQYLWLSSSTIDPGVYHIRISEACLPSSSGTSEPFTVTAKTAEVENEGFDVFSPSSANAAAGIFSAANATTPDQPLQPHEQRRLEKLAAEKQRFQEMDVSQYSAPLGDPCTIDRLHKPTKDQFMKNYAELGKPVIITGVMDDWEAMKYWNFEEIGNHLSKGVKVDGMEMLTPYSRWDEYRRTAARGHRQPVIVQMDDFHLLYPEMMQDIRGSDLFVQGMDFLEAVDEDIRPPSLLFRMASQRAGHHWQVTSLNASSWTALFTGRKRWGLYPPERYFLPGAVHNNNRLKNSQLSQPYVWWTHTYPHLAADHRPKECLQKPGEILFIPSGWWWSNVNLEDSITLQKSLCDTNCIESCLRELRELADSGDVNYSGDIFIQLRRQLLQHSPDLLTDEDLRFVSPVKGRGETEEELEDSFERNLWETYFEDSSRVDIYQEGLVEEDYF